MPRAALAAAGDPTASSSATATLDPAADTAPDPAADVLLDLGWDASRRAALNRARADLGLPDLVPARVTGVERGRLDCATSAGPVAATAGAALLAAAARDPVAAAGTGDWVALRGWPDGRTTAEVVLDRRGALVRHGAARAAVGQLLASGVDVVGVVEPLWPEPELGRIERFLVLAWESGALPLVLLTKADLAEDTEWLLQDVARAAPGAEVLLLSTVTGQGLEDLRARLGRGRTLALVGRSGAGKSSIVNALAGEDVLAVGDVRRDGKGRHTSTRRELVVLPGTGVLVDTPGLRGVGLSAVEDGLEAAFEDVTALAASCRFRDCAHGSEPGCAVLAAVADGSLPQRRLDSWHKLQREARWVARRNDARARAEARKEWARISRSVRGLSRP